MDDNYRIKRQKYLIIRRLPRKLGRFFYAWFQCFGSLGFANGIMTLYQDTGEGDTATTGNSFQGLEERRRAEKSESGTGCIGPKNTAWTCAAGWEKEQRRKQRSNK